MTFLNKRQIEIINFLKDVEDYISLKSLSEKFNITERSIRNDIDLIGEVLKENNIKLDKNSKKGVKINANSIDIDDILESYQNKIYSSEERCIIIAIILIVKRETTIENLTKDILVSKNTIVNDLKYSENLLKLHNIYLKKKSYKGLKVEEDYKKLLEVFLKFVNYLDKSLYKRIINIICNYLNIEYKKIKLIIEKIEQDKNIRYTDESIKEVENIIIFSLCHNKNKKNENKKLEYIRNIIYNFTNIYINDERLEIINVTLKSGKKINYDKTEKIEKDIENITEEIIDEMCHIFNIEKTLFDEFISQMKMHINIAIRRVRNNFNIENPILEETKYKMPLIYEITKKVLYTKKDVIGFLFPDEEIAFITMYFGILFEKHLKENLYTNTIIVCNGGLATSSLLKSRINLMLPEINIKSILSVRDVLDNSLDGIDFIISTVSIKVDGYKVIKVSPLLEIEDCDKIRYEIYNRWYENNRKYILNKIGNSSNICIGNLIPKNYVNFSDTTDWRMAIKEATQPLIKDKKVRKEYILDMINVVEKLGNYMVFIPEIAFIHASPQNVLKNSVAYLNLSSKIEFGIKNKVLVKTIVVLANTNENKNLIHLVNILDNKNNLNIFKNAKDYEDIKNLF